MLKHPDSEVSERDSMTSLGKNLEMICQFEQNSWKKNRYAAISKSIFIDCMYIVSYIKHITLIVVKII
jgi:hypothetical protein